jgi:hypothetical protein
MRDKVFISYSRTDKKWLEQLKKWLKQFVREEKISIWDDTKIAAGADWREEIKRALQSTRVAVLLVSQDFLASDFIQRDELPPLLEAAENDEAKILWMAVRPSMYKDTVIARYQALNEPSKPLSTLKTANQETALVKICEKIKAVLSVIQFQSRSEDDRTTGPEAAGPSVTGGAVERASTRPAEAAGGTVTGGAVKPASTRPAEAAGGTVTGGAVERASTRPAEAAGGTVTGRAVEPASTRPAEAAGGTVTGGAVEPASTRPAEAAGATVTAGGV